ncbi:MAG TPA: division/cell wall cluster transcriptional repressor MraZ [Thermoleophilaceae bacterium]|nr:division/cell wall cluster transcriptional repressor MraZ [Thermoleophilaceae bacterium]
MTFRGNFDYSLDAKNRLAIPPKFRAAFSDGLVLMNWLDPCIAVFTPEGFETFTTSFLEGLHPLSPERRELSRRLVGGSFDRELDSAGRVTLAGSLLEHSGISKDVVVVGNVDYLEIWDRERWGAAQPELDTKVARIAESLGNPS